MGVPAPHPVWTPSALTAFSLPPQHARANHVRLLVDAEYTSINPALSLLVAALAVRWNSPEEGGPWVWNTYQAYLKVGGGL